MHTIFPDQTVPGQAPDPATSIPLYRSPRFATFTFERVISGTDLFAYRHADGTTSLWLWHWSDEPGEKGVASCVPEEFAIRFIREQLFDSPSGCGLEHTNLMEYLPDLYWAAERKNGK